MPSSPTNTTTAAIKTGTSTVDDTKLLAQLRDRHRTMLWLSIAILAAAFVLQARPTGDVGPAFWPNVSLPLLCGSRALFNTECPGCGLTRSFIALAGGNFQESLQYNRVGWLLALAVVLQIPYRLFALGELRTKIPVRLWPTWFGYLLIAALVINWLLKVSGLY